MLNSVSLYSRWFFIMSSIKPWNNLYFPCIFAWRFFDLPTMICCITENDYSPFWWLDISFFQFSKLEPPISRFGRHSLTFLCRQLSTHYETMLRNSVNDSLFPALPYVLFIRPLHNLFWERALTVKLLSIRVMSGFKIGLTADWNSLNSRNLIMRGHCIKVVGLLIFSPSTSSLVQDSFYRLLYPLKNYFSA